MGLELVIFGGGLILLIALTSIVLHKFNIKRFAISFAIGHLIFIIIVSCFYFLSPLAQDAQGMLFWIIPGTIDYPISLLVALLAMHTHILLGAILLAILGSVQYFTIGWIVDFLISKDKKELLPTKRSLFLFVVVSLFIFLWAYRNYSYLKLSEYEKSKIELDSSKTELDRFYALNDVAKASFNEQRYEEAKTYAEELLSLAEKYKDSWNYGNAIYDAHLVLGRIALINGNITQAKEHLLAAAQTPGSPQLDSFGPNMSLAKDLLEIGQEEIVINFLNLCRKFWYDTGKIDEWISQIKNGQIPDFGANLFY